MATPDLQEQNQHPPYDAAALIVGIREALAHPQVQSNPWLQKLLQIVLSILTLQPFSIKESGNYTKSQSVPLLGTTWDFSETLSGSIEISGTPQASAQTDAVHATPGGGDAPPA